MLVLAMTLAAATLATEPRHDPLAAFYGNTLIARDGNIESHFYYRRDHTFSGVVPQYDFALKGTWSVKPDGTVCRIFKPAVPRVKNPDCGPMLVHAIGDKKTFDDGDSQMLVKGIR